MKVTFDSNYCNLRKILISVNQRIATLFFYTGTTNISHKCVRNVKIPLT